MLKLNVGLNKKIGEAAYGSRGASAELQLEAESSLVDRPDRLRERIRPLFALAKASVDEELNGANPSQANRHAGDGHGRRRDDARKATASQARALHVIADRQRVDLAGLLRHRFGVDTAGDLTIREASAMIDEMKSSAKGIGGRR
jgi:hypothetical protein